MVDDVLNKQESNFSSRLKQELLAGLRERLETSPIVIPEYQQQNLYNRLQTNYNYGRRSTGKDISEYGFADQFVLYASLLAHIKFTPFYASMCIRNLEFAEILKTLFWQVFKVRVDVKSNLRSVTFLIRRSNEKRLLADFLKHYFGFDDEKMKLDFNWQNLDLIERRSFLQGLFLSTASIADPRLTYQLEFIVKYPDLANVCLHLLRWWKIPAAKMPNNCRKIVIRSGDSISDFLALLGSQKQLMEYENIRIEKQIRGGVNRVLNCDNHNVAKTVDAALVQLADINYLVEKIGMENIPEDLQYVAKLRLANPECSLTELVNMSDHQLSRSGINYRIKKLQNLAASLKATDN